LFLYILFLFSFLAETYSNEIYDAGSHCGLCLDRRTQCDHFSQM
jgi:hypothetical protein